jgi:hypothetical protein
MNKLTLIALSALALLAFTPPPIPATVTFAEGTTLTQAVAALGEARPVDDLYYSTPGMAFVYVRDRSVQRREEGIWKMDVAMTKLDGGTPPENLVDCWKRHDCPPITVSRVDIDNPPADLAGKAQVESVFQPTYLYAAREIIKDFFN